MVQMSVTCDKAFSRSGNIHMRVHTGDKPYKCSLCTKSFSDSNNLQSHKRHVHSNRRRYHCPYCGKLFNREHGLKCPVHIHTGAKPYSFRNCSENFTSLVQLKTHLMKLHTAHVPRLLLVSCRAAQPTVPESWPLLGHMLAHPN